MTRDDASRAADAVDPAGNARGIVVHPSSAVSSGPATSSVTPATAGPETDWNAWKAHLIVCAPCTAGYVCSQGDKLLGGAEPGDAPWLHLEARDDDGIILLVWAEWAEKQGNEGAAALFRRVADRIALAVVPAPVVSGAPDMASRFTPMGAANHRYLLARAEAAIRHAAEAGAPLGDWSGITTWAVAVVTLEATHRARVATLEARLRDATLSIEDAEALSALVDYAATRGYEDRTLSAATVASACDVRNRLLAATRAAPRDDAGSSR